MESKARSEIIELAKAYVALSNAHQLDVIIPMFTETAQYHSSTVGEFHGQPAIGAMMASFFTRFNDVYWLVDDYRYIDNQRVEFDFIMTATDAEKPEFIERRGVETIEFNADGKISAIQVLIQA